MSDDTPPLTFTRPFRSTGTAVLDATGRVVAQGRPWLCERVVAGLPVLVEQPDLLTEVAP